MARPQKRVGELGGVRFIARGDKVLARADIRVGDGSVRSVSAVGVDKATAKALLERKAGEIWGFSLGRPALTVGDLAEAWLSELADQLASGVLGAVKQQTIETYTSVVRTNIRPRIWTLPVGDFTVSVADGFLRTIAREKSTSSAKHTRTALVSMFDLAIRRGTVETQSNPARGTASFRASGPQYIELDLHQLTVILELMRDYVGGARGPRRAARFRRLLMDLVLLTLGTSARIGEVLALRRSDIRCEPGVGYWAYIGGTITRTKPQGAFRQDSPKRESQKRWVRLPPFAAKAAVRLLSEDRTGSGDNPDRLLLRTANGTAYERTNVLRWLREFRGARRLELEAVGIDVDRLTFRAFRKTSAKVTADRVGIGQAAALLGHSSPKITAAHYAKPQVPMVDGAAGALDDAFGGLLE